MFHQSTTRCLIAFMDSQNLNTNTPNDLDGPGLHYQHQFLQDLSLIHEKFVDLWFKHINYFESHSGQLPAENLEFIDGLNFVECCFLQKELDMMADVVAEYVEQDNNKPQDYYTVEFDMNAQVSAYMNYIDKRLTTLHNIQGLFKAGGQLPGFSFFLGSEGKG
jgi:hypothetical protein